MNQRCKQIFQTYFIFILCAVLFVSLCACDVAENIPADQIRVSVTEAFGTQVADNFCLINSGEDVTFQIKTKAGFAVVGSDYTGRQAIEQTDEGARLTLYEVLYPTAVELVVTGQYCTIVYMPNGGWQKNGKEEAYRESYSLESHMRPNTATDLFERQGYTLYSWNTEPDGSGLPIGLGSRVTVGAAEDLTLYAQWARHSDAAEFAVEKKGDYVRIEKYTGAEKQIVIPDTIGGLPVKVIARGAFNKCTADTVILPDTIEYVQEGAFVSCGLQELYLFDSICGVYAESFIGCDALSTVHINAKRPPAGYALRRESAYADKADRLILAAGKKKAVFFGGCGVWYNIDGAVMEERLQGYEVINMGLNGAVNGTIQAEILLALMEEGDVLIHIPEENSPYQLFAENRFTSNDEKLWCGIEMNYDLFSLVDLRTCSGALESLCAYNNGKSARCSYEDVYRDETGNMYTDTYGGIPFERKESCPPLHDAADITTAVFPLYGSPLADVYARFGGKGISVYVSYAPINVDALPVSHANAENYAAYQKAFCSYVQEGGHAAVISVLEDQIFPAEQFYDSNFHLLSGAARNYTKRLADEIVFRLANESLL